MTKPSDDSKPIDKPLDKPTEPAKAPDAYAAFTAPEGTTLDAKLIEQAAPIFKELGLTQEQAQRLVTLQASRELANAKSQGDAIETMKTQWRNEVMANKDLADSSGLRKDVEANIGRVKAALPAEFRGKLDTMMTATGFGNNPVLVEMFNHLAPFITEGKSVVGGGPSPHGQRDPSKGARPSPAQALYPNLPSAAG